MQLKEKGWLNAPGGSIGLLVLSCALFWGFSVGTAFAQPFRPSNDNFTNAWVLIGDMGTTNGNNFGATNEIGEPIHSENFFFAVGTNSVWFTWTPSTNGIATFDTKRSFFDTILAVYVGDAVDALFRVAINDDFNPPGGERTNLSSQVTFFANPNTAYRIAIVGYQENDFGSYFLNWNLSTTTIITNIPPGTNQIQFSLPAFIVNESTPGFATISVDFNGRSDAPVSVDYFTADGTARAGRDYLSVSNTLTFLPGETTKTFTVQILDNPTLNSNRSVNLFLRNPQGATLGPVNQAVLIIRDDEAVPSVSGAGQFQFTATSYKATENESSFSFWNDLAIPVAQYERNVLGALITVTRVGGNTGRVLVDYYTTNKFEFTNTFFNPFFVFNPFFFSPFIFGGSSVAVENLDYVPVSGTLVFDDFQTSTNFLVPILKRGFFFPTNILFNASKLVNLVLTNPRPDPNENPEIIVPSIGAISNATLVIIETDNYIGFSIERAYYRGNEYGPASNRATNVVAIDVILPGGGPGSVLVRIASVNSYIFPLAASSDYADQNRAFYATTPTTDGSSPPENPQDFLPQADGARNIIINFPDATVSDVRILITNINDTVVEFNEDIYVDLFPLSGNPPIGPNGDCNITILYDDQPPGIADRQWNPAAVSSTTPAFNNTPGANNTVNAVAVQADQRTVIGGDFTAYNSVSRNRLARINPDGAIDPTFNPGTGADDFVATIALYSTNQTNVAQSGKIMVGGGFTSINGRQRNSIARLNSDGSVDATFNPGNGANAPVRSIGIQTDGKILIAGDFTFFNGEERQGVARLNEDGSLDPGFNPVANGTVWSIAVRDAPEAIFIPRNAFGTELEDRNVIETGSRRGLIIIDYDFQNVPDNLRIYYEGVRIYNLDTNGTNQITIPYGGANSTSTIVTIVMNEGIGIPGTIWSYKANIIPVIEERKIYIGGDFNRINGDFRQRVAALNDDGSLDQTFFPGDGPDASVYSVAVQPNGKLLIGGAFHNVDFRPRNAIARFNSDGTVDTTFNPGLGFDDPVFAITLQPDGKPLVGGIFTSFNETRRMGLARLFTDGSLDTGFLDTGYNQFAGLIKKFSFEPNNFVNSIGLETNGSVMIGGSFTNLGGNGAFEIVNRTFYRPVWTRQDKTTRYNVARLIGSWGFSSNEFVTTVITPTSTNDVTNIVVTANGPDGPGNVEFITDDYRTDENAGILSATLRRVNGRLGSVFATAVNSNRVAVAGEDFTLTGLPSVWPEWAYRAPRSVGYVGLRYLGVPLLDDQLVEGDETVDLHFFRPGGSMNLGSEFSIFGRTSLFIDASVFDPTNEFAQFDLGGEFIPLGGALTRRDATLTIADNDFSRGTIGFDFAEFSIDENGTNGIITLTRTNGFTGVVGVDYFTVDGSAAAGTDYVEARGTLTFVSGQTNAVITIPLINDTQVELDKTLSIVLTNATGGAKLPGGQVTSTTSTVLRIVDDDFPSGRLNFSSMVFTTNEAAGEATITIRRSGGNLGAVSVQYEATNGTATAGSDFVAVAGTLTWASGESAPKSFVVPLIDENPAQVEGNGTNSVRYETVSLRLHSPSIANSVGNIGQAELWILDDDSFGAFAFSTPIFATDENGTRAIITVVRQGGTAGDASVNYDAAGGTAVPPSDYAPTSGTLNFAPGEVSKTFAVEIADDTVSDGDKTVELTLSGASPGATLGTLSRSRLLIIDNESSAIPAGTLDTTFNAGAGPNNPVYALALQTNSSLLIAGDFTRVNNIPRNSIARLTPEGILDRAFNAGSGPDGPIRAMALQDDGRILIGGFFNVVDNTNRSHIARLNTDGGLDAFFNPGAGVDNPVYAIVLQPDGRIVIGGSFNTVNSVTRPGIARLNTNGTLNASFITGTGVDGIVYALALQSDGKIILGGDFTSVNNTNRTRIARVNGDGSLDLSFNPGTGADGAVRAIAVQSDGKILIGGSFTNVNGLQRRTLARLNSDGSVDTSFLSGQAGGNGPILAIVVQADSRIVLGGDFTTFNGVNQNRIARLTQDGSIDPSINFGFGANGFVATLAIQPDRKIVLGGGFTAVNAQPRNHVARVHGGSIAGSGTLEFSAPFFDVSEDGTAAIVSVRRLGGTAGAITVDFFTSDGTANSGADYQGVTNTLTFQQGENFESIVIPIFQDTLVENPETVNLIVTNAAGGGALGPQPVATLRIISDDSVISFAAASYSVNEAVQSRFAAISVARSGATNSAVSATFRTVTGGTATSTNDYRETNQVVRFAPAETNKIINVPIINDNLVEGSETVNLALSAPTGPAVLGTNTALLTIVDDDIAPGVLTFTSPSYLVAENQTNAVITVIRTNGNSGFVSVRYAATNGTAMSGTDYTVASGILAFSDGETVKTFTVPIVNDDILEPDETVDLILSEPLGGAFLGAITNATLVIQDDEFAPSIFAFATTNFLVNETAGTATVSVVRTNSRRGEVSVRFETSAGTATPGLDYINTNGTLLFLDGEGVKTFNIAILDDRFGEPDETVNLRLFNPSGTNSVGQTSSILIIVNNDTTFRFASANFTIAENAGFLLATVFRLGVSNTPVSVDFSTVPSGTAVGGLDYVATNGTLRWAANDAAPKTVRVRIFDNTGVTGDKTFSLILSNAIGTNTFLEPPTNALVTIIDNETENPPAGEVDPTFNAALGANAAVHSVAFDIRERLYIGGEFTAIHGFGINRVARLDTNGTVDVTFNPGSGADGTVFAVARSTNGLVIGGAFTNVNGLGRPGVARLNLDGSVDFRFSPNNGANNAVFALAVGTNDQVLIGGLFTQVNGVQQNRIARLNANGSLDTSFTSGAGANNAVRAIAIQTNSQIIIAGEFTVFDNVLVNRLARLNPDGSFDFTFNVGLGADAPIRALALDRDGRILIGGDFTTINGVPRNHIARLNFDGSVDLSFNPGEGANGEVRSIALQNDGRILLVGAFSSVDGNTYNNIARLNPDGAVDTTFEIGTGSDAPVNAVALANVTSSFVIPRQASGDFNEDRFTVDTGANAGIIIIDYDFLFVLDNIRVYYDGVRIFDLTTNGFDRIIIPYGPGNSTLVTVVMNEGSGDPGTAWFYTLTINTAARLDNRIGIGGEFSQVNGQPRGRVAVLNSGGSLYSGFDPSVGAGIVVYDVAIYTNAAQPALLGKLVVGGDFGSFAGAGRRNNITRLNLDGPVDASFNTGEGPDGSVRAVALQPDGKTIIGGTFTTLDFFPRAYLARLNVNGSLDSGFNAGAGLNNSVLALALQLDGRILIGGAFSQVYGVSRNGIARVHTNGTVDVTFNPGAGVDGTVNAIALAPDGRVYIGGTFANASGTARNRIARLNSNGSLDTSFNPGSGANGSVDTIALLPNGQIVIGGTFTSVNGVNLNRIARLNSDGNVDAGFLSGAGANDFVGSIVVQPDGKLVVGGGFTAFNGQSHNRVVRLNPNGSVDETINFGAGANNFITTVALQTYDEKIVVGGGFTEFDGEIRIALARLFGGTNFGNGRFQFSSAAYRVVEGTNAVVTILRAGGAMGSASILFTTSDGSAAGGADYRATNGVITFGPGEAVKTILIPTTDSSGTNTDRTFTVSLSTPTGGATLGTPSSAVVTIADNDSVLTFSASGYTVTENGGAARITVVRRGGNNQTVTVDYATGTNGTAEPFFDYLPVSATLVFNPGVNAQTFLVPILDDTFVEARESIELTLVRPTGPATLGSSNAVLNIADDEISPGVLSFATNNFNAREDQASVTISVVRTGGFSGTISVNFSTSNGSATGNIDYGSTNGILTFAEGETNKTFVVPINQDLLVEGTETILLRLSNPGGGATLGQANAALFLADDDSAGAFIFDVDEFSASEGAGLATIRVHRSGGSIGLATVTYQTIGGTATAPLDYTAVSNVLTFANGETNKTFTIPIAEDALIEGTETVNLILSNPTGRSAIGLRGTATLLILDNEMSIGFAAPSLRVAETGGVATVRISRIGNTNVPVTVTVTATSGTAVEGSDFVATNAVLTFAPGETNIAFTVQLVDDTLAEGEETFNLTLSNPGAGASLGTQITTGVTIIDNDITVEFASATINVTESFTNVTINVIRAGGSNDAVSVQFATSDGTATEFEDYFPANGTLNFAAGETNKTFTVQILDDFVGEGAETVNLTLSNPGGGAFVGLQGTAVLSILDTDVSIGFSQTNYVVSEKASNVVITLVRTGRITGAVEATFITGNGTATANQDYRAFSNVVTWVSGDATPKTIVLTILNDAVLEGSETVNLLLFNPVGGAILSPASAILSIVDNAGSIAFTSGNFTVTEGAGTAALTLVRTGGSNGIVTVNYLASGGSAFAGQDYTNPTGTVAFASGEVTKTLNLPIVDDSAVEGIETLNVTLLSAGGGALVAEPRATTLTIVDNDVGIIVASGSALTAESFSPPNNIIDAGETVTVLLALRNTGTVSTRNLTATLQPGAGISNPSGAQSYGTVVAGGASVSRPFQFTASTTNGGRVTLTLLLEDRGVSLGFITYSFGVGQGSISFANANPITINDISSATPYPSVITVSGIPGPVNKVTVTLNGLTHRFPDDIDMVLVSPGGQAVTLMSDAGGGNRLTGVTVTFDDAAGTTIPDAAVIASGTYRSANYNPANDPFPAPAPPQPYSGALSAFIGSTANGPWSLYIVDDTGQDAGEITGGWSLALIASAEVTPVSDLSVTVTDTPDPVPVGGVLAYSIAVRNHGPTFGNNIVITNVLPAGVTFLSATSSRGTVSPNGGRVVGNIGALPMDGQAVINITVRVPSIPTTLTNTVVVAGTESDLNLGDNIASVKTSVISVPVLSVTRKGEIAVSIVISWPEEASSFILESSPSLAPASWSPVSSQPTVVNGENTVSIPVAGSLARFFRLRAP